MKYLLIWVIATSSGGITSGAAEFENQQSCQSAGSVLNSSVREAQGKAGRRDEAVSFQCSPKGQTKP